MYHRIIARLDIKGSNLVKGIHLEGIRVLGSPELFAKYYYETGADELMYMDVVASLYNRNSLHDIIAKTAKQIFIPLTVGGGIRTLEDIRKALRAGADKVALNTAAIKNPEIIQRAANMFGSSTIVLSVEAKRMPDGSYEAYTDNGRERTGVEAVGWAKHATSLGAGEVVITSIDREGTGKGFDLELTEAIASTVSVPVIACGGAGKTQDVVDVLATGHADAVSLASLLHYHAVTALPATIQETHVNHFNQNANTRIEATTISKIKEMLNQHGIHCRTTP